jgi:hypothetical protein
LPSEGKGHEFESHRLRHDFCGDIGMLMLRRIFEALRAKSQPCIFDDFSAIYAGQDKEDKSNYFCFGVYLPIEESLVWLPGSTNDPDVVQVLEKLKPGTHFSILSSDDSDWFDQGLGVHPTDVYVSDNPYIFNIEGVPHTIEMSDLVLLSKPLQTSRTHPHHQI